MEEEKKEEEQNNTETSAKTVNNKFIRALLTVSGSVSLVLGIAGIFLPVLPTTPFLLLSAFCYARSSEKFYLKLINSRHLGSYIRNYREYKAVTLKTKIISVSLLWITILLSAFVFIDIIYVRIILLIIACAVTVHILSIKTLK